MIQQRLDARIFVEINVRIGMIVACQEFFNTERARGMSRTQQDGIAVATRNQLHPPEDECPHDYLAQLAVGLNERQQLLPFEMNYVAGFAHTYLNHCASAA